jgi:hypothetical protein
MAVKGLQASVLVLIVVVVLGYLLALLWPGFGVA